MDQFSNNKTLRALVDCLIPADDFPGASEAGVCDFLARLFGSDLSQEIDFFHTGLEAVEAEAIARFNRKFAELPHDQQVLTLQAIESGHVSTEWMISPERFFEMLVNTTAEGYYSDPQQGGNRGGASWVMTGFEQNPEL